MLREHLKCDDPNQARGYTEYCWEKAALPWAKFEEKFLVHSRKLVKSISSEACQYECCFDWSGNIPDNSAELKKNLTRIHREAVLTSECVACSWVTT